MRVISDVLTTVTMKIRILWNVTHLNMMDIY